MAKVLLRAVHDDGVAVLTFNRPDERNAWSADLHVAYLEALRELADDERVRAVVVTGAGVSFCVGADVSLPGSVLDGEDLPPAMRSKESFLEPIDFPKPLIAAVNGAAAGLGFVHALLCDVRFAAQSALFATAFVQRGLVAEHGIAWLLTQIVGRGVALDLLLSSRQVTAVEAERLGLVHRVVPEEDLLDEAMAYARGLAKSSSPASMNAMKHQVNRHSTLSLTEAEQASRTLIDEALVGPDFAEGVQSFLERRPAAFAPLGAGTQFTFAGARATASAGAAEGFLAAASGADWDTALALLSPDVVVMTHPGGVASGASDVVDRWRAVRAATGPWESRDLRRCVDDRGFFEQHRMGSAALGLEWDMTIVGTVDAAGRIARWEQYVDADTLPSDAWKRVW